MNQLVRLKLIYGFYKSIIGKEWSSVVSFVDDAVKIYEVWIIVAIFYIPFIKLIAKRNMDSMLQPG